MKHHESVRHKDGLPTKCFSSTLIYGAPTWSQTQQGPLEGVLCLPWPPMLPPTPCHFTLFFSFSCDNIMTQVQVLELLGSNMGLTTSN